MISVPEDAYNALEGLRSMAGRNIIAALEAHNARFESKLDAQNAKIDSLRWVLGAALRIFS
jgi:hypothetical protein